MMLTKCYYVVYHIADFAAADDEFICHQDTYRDHNNALLVAKDLAKCLDVADNVFVIDGLTGEVLNTILKDAPQEDKAPADNTSTPVDTYKDKNGDIWFRISDGRWRIDCANRHCADCPYYSEEGDCIVQEPLHDADRNYQVELARLRTLAKAKKTEEEENSISTNDFNDETDGVWHLTEDNKWNYDCTGLMCSDCAYCDEDYCLVHSPMTEEERDIQIESAKARMKK